MITGKKDETELGASQPLALPCDLAQIQGFWLEAPPSVEVRGQREARMGQIVNKIGRNLKVRDKNMRK